MIGSDLGPDLLCNWTNGMLKGHSHNSTIVRTSVGGKYIPFRRKSDK